jgi:hypothetical membrane protein
VAVNFKSRLVNFTAATGENRRTLNLGFILVGIFNQKKRLLDFLFKIFYYVDFSCFLLQFLVVSILVNPMLSFFCLFTILVICNYLKNVFLFFRVDINNVCEIF